VPDVEGNVLRTVTYSRVSPRHRLAAWVRLLALTAAHPERGFESLTIGRARKDSGGRVTVARIPPLPPGAAREQLATMLDLYDRGMREPPPLACLSSAAYASAGSNAAAAGREAWESGFAFDKEDREPEHQLVLGGVRTFVELNEEAPRPDERGDGWDEREVTRFGRYARRMWDGLLAREELTDR
jgi:exodeoxyribonuclease V gamma subunit